MSNKNQTKESQPPNRRTSQRLTTQGTSSKSSTPQKNKNIFETPKSPKSTMEEEYSPNSKQNLNPLDNNPKTPNSA